MPNPDIPEESVSEHPIRKRGLGRATAKLGIVLILFSGVLWFFLFAIPFLPLTVGQKTTLAAADFVGVQIAWWAGAALAGPRTVAKLKSWFARRKKTDRP